MALSRVLIMGFFLATLPACFTPARVAQAPMPPVRSERIVHARAPAPSGGLQNPYSTVLPYANRKQPIAATLAKQPEETELGPLRIPEETAKEPNLVRPDAVKKPTEPVAVAVLPDPPPAAPVVPDDPPLVVALRYCHEKRINDALDALKSFDPINQEALLTLLPITVRMSEGSLDRGDPEEIAIILEQLQSLITTLQPRAALRMEKLSFCKFARKFGVFEAIEGKPSFRAGDIVDLYAELRNISCEKHQSRMGDFRIRTSSTLEIREAGGNSGWRKEVPKIEFSRTVQHDFYHHYRFELPDLTPGPYLLSVEVADLPTGRKVRQKLEFRVMP